MSTAESTPHYIRVLERELGENKTLTRAFADLYMEDLPPDSLVGDAFLSFCFQRLEEGGYASYRRAIEDVRANTDRIMGLESLRAREYAVFFLIYLLLKHQADRSWTEDFNKMRDIILEKLEGYTHE